MFLCFGGALTDSQTELWYSKFCLALQVSLRMSQVLPPGTVSLSLSYPGSWMPRRLFSLLWHRNNKSPWQLGSAVTSFVLGELECVSLSRQPGSPIIGRGLLFHYQIGVLNVSWPNSCQPTSCFSYHMVSYWFVYHFLFVWHTSLCHILLQF